MFICAVFCFRSACSIEHQKCEKICIGCSHLRHWFVTCKGFDKIALTLALAFSRFAPLAGEGEGGASLVSAFLFSLFILLRRLLICKSFFPKCYPGYEAHPPCYRLQVTPQCFLGNTRTSTPTCTCTFTLTLTLTQTHARARTRLCLCLCLCPCVCMDFES